jgi:hypothetical protein
MMIGEKSKFIRNFKNLGKESVNPNPEGPSIAPANKTVPTETNPYEKMFIFEIDFIDIFLTKLQNY